eukprot:4504915-Prymnesium_polylepis.2
MCGLLWPLPHLPLQPFPLTGGLLWAVPQVTGVHGRRQSVNDYRKTLGSLWEGYWDQVKLSHLPGDATGLAAWEPSVKRSLGVRMQLHFQVRPNLIWHVPHLIWQVAHLVRHAPTFFDALPCSWQTLFDAYRFYADVTLQVRADLIWHASNMACT